jgi:hypothetical protein
LAKEALVGATYLIPLRNDLNLIEVDPENWTGS